MICRNCKNQNFRKIFKLGSQPISSTFLKKKKKIKSFSLDLYLCKKCNLVQLKEIPRLKDMYGKNYGYKTSVSNLMVNHLKKKYETFKKKKILQNHSNILDIGSNDGTFLNFFAKNNKNLNLYGIDPSATAFEDNYDKKIYLIKNFFSEKILRKKLIKNKKFSLIVSYAMFYDVEDPNNFCKNISKILDDKGIWSLEFSYFPLLLKNLTYDQICHEHCTYYTLNTFKKIVEKNGLKITELNVNEINGGSIEVSCAKKDSNHRVNKKKILKFLSYESKITNNVYKNFQKRVIQNKKELINFLKKIKSKKIIGYGASTKGNVILNYCKLNDSSLKYICDENKKKHGKFTPGSKIKIISKNKMRKIMPDYLLVLIWSFRKEVIRQELDFINKGGKLIFPLPKFHVVNKYNFKSYLKKSLDTISKN